MNKLKEILAKEPADLSADEKSFVTKHWAKLNDEQKTKFADAAPQESDEDDEEEDGETSKAITELVQKSVMEALEKDGKKIAEDLLTKFMVSAADQRKKAIEGGQVMNADRSEKNAVTRDFLKALLTGDRARLKALTTNNDITDPSPDDAGAGQLIPQIVSNEIIRVAAGDFGLARREFFNLPFSGPGNSRIVPALGTSVSVYWTDEGQKKKSTQPKFNVVTQTLKKLAAICPMTEEIVEDSAIDLLSLVSTLFGEAMAEEEDKQFFNGTGSPWTGILNSTAVNQVDMAGAKTTITIDDLQAMIDATPSGALNGAKFYMHRSVLSKIRLLREGSGTGAYLVAPATQGAPQELLGYPVVTSDAFPAWSAVSNGVEFILFGNLKQGAIFGEKGSMRVKLLTEATISDTDDESLINLAEQDMVALRVVERVGYTIARGTAMTVLAPGA